LSYFTSHHIFSDILIIPDWQGICQFEIGVIYEIFWDSSTIS
jgi:hypothetical protein